MTPVDWVLFVVYAAICFAVTRLVVRWLQRNRHIGDDPRSRRIAYRIVFGVVALVAVIVIAGARKLIGF